MKYPKHVLVSILHIPLHLTLQSQAVYLSNILNRSSTGILLAVMLNSINITPIICRNTHSRSLSAMDLAHCGLDRIMTRCFGDITIVSDLEAASEVFRSQECQHNDVQVDTAHEDTHYKTILVSLSLSLWWQWESGTDGRFDG